MTDEMSGGVHIAINPGALGTKLSGFRLKPSSRPLFRDDDLDLGSADEGEESDAEMGDGAAGDVEDGAEEDAEDGVEQDLGEEWGSIRAEHQLRSQLENDVEWHEELGQTDIASGEPVSSPVGRAEGTAKRPTRQREDAPHLRDPAAPPGVISARLSYFSSLQGQPGSTGRPRTVGFMPGDHGENKLLASISRQVQKFGEIGRAHV